VDLKAVQKAEMDDDWASFKVREKGASCVCVCVCVCACSCCCALVMRYVCGVAWLFVCFVCLQARGGDDEGHSGGGKDTHLSFHSSSPSLAPPLAPPDHF
jgi:hypothetical protein